MKSKLLILLLLASVIVGFFAFTPEISFAQEPLIQDCEAGDGECGLDDLVALVQRVINWIIMIFAPIAMIMFAWAGVLMVTAGGNKGQIDRAKGIFTNVAIGLVIVLSAWLIVYTITTTLLKDPDLPVGLEPTE
jgi:hypothetical protein